MRLRMPFKLIKEEKALRKAINHFSEQPVYFQKKIPFLVLKIKSDKHRRRGHPIFFFFFSVLPPYSERARGSAQGGLLQLVLGK